MYAESIKRNFVLFSDIKIKIINLYTLKYADILRYAEYSFLNRNKTKHFDEGLGDFILIQGYWEYMDW